MSFVTVAQACLFPHCQFALKWDTSYNQMDINSYQNLIRAACGNEHEGLQCEDSLSAPLKTHGKDSPNAPRHNTHLHMQIANQTQFQNLI